MTRSLPSGSRTPLGIGEVFWLIIVLALPLAVFLPVWLKLVITLAEWSWGLIG